MNKSLKKQIEKAQAEMATWTPERRANVVLQGGDGSLAIGRREMEMTEFKYADFATWWDQQTDIDDDSEALARRIFKAARAREEASFVFNFQLTKSGHLFVAASAPKGDENE